MHPIQLNAAAAVEALLTDEAGGMLDAADADYSRFAGDDVPRLQLIAVVLAVGLLELERLREDESELKMDMAFAEAEDLLRGNAERGRRNTEEGGP